MGEEKVGSLVRSSLWDCCEYLGLVWTPTPNWRTSVPSVRSCWHGPWRQLKIMAFTSSGLLHDWQDLTENFFPCPQKHSQKVELLGFCYCCFTSAREKKRCIQTNVTAALWACGPPREGHPVPHVSHPTLCSQVPCGSLGLAGEQRSRALRRLIDVAVTQNRVSTWGRMSCESHDSM